MYTYITGRKKKDVSLGCGCTFNPFRPAIFALPSGEEKANKNMFFFYGQLLFRPASVCVYTDLLKYFPTKRAMKQTENQSVLGEVTNTLSVKS